MSECVDHGRVGCSLGYSTIRISGVHIGVHRLVYCLYHNVSLDSISGLVVRHMCNNPRCVNPAHLNIGTQQDNMNDRCASGNTYKGERHGNAKLTNETVPTIRRVVLGAGWTHIEE